MSIAMDRHALIIGSQILGLRGVHNDIEVMERLLSSRGFAVTKLVEKEATRDKILAAYDELIERTEKQHAVVIYYSGHGGYAEDKVGRRVQYILPTDWVEDEDTFRGITDAELSSQLAKLTDKTTNVTVILDCCHAALMSKGPEADPPPGLVARVRPGKWTAGLAAFVERNTPERVHVIGNPHAVRLVATEADREAFEAAQLIDDQWVPRGYFTRALQRVLEETGTDALTWRGVRDRVREQVLSVVRQRPCVEGPADRVLFTTSEASRPDAVVYFERDGKHSLRASRILGARVGARYDVVRRGETVLSPGTIVATATITELEGSIARVSLSDVKDQPQTGALAFPQTSPFPAMTVALAGCANAPLRVRLAGCPLIQLVERAQARFVVETGDAGVVLSDDENPLDRFTLEDNDDGRELVAQRIERWAKAEALRALQPGGLPDAAIELAWGCIVDGELVRRSPGSALHVGDRLCVRATNATPKPLYLWIFDIGIVGRVKLLTVASGGQTVQPGGALAVGDDGGLPLSWARDLESKVGPRRESIIVLAADHWTDVSVFETPHLRSKGLEPSALEDLLQNLGSGTARGNPSEPVVQKYGVARIDFDLHPVPRHVA